MVNTPRVECAMALVHDNRMKCFITMNSTNGLTTPTKNYNEERCV